MQLLRPSKSDMDLEEFSEGGFLLDRYLETFKRRYKLIILISLITMGAAFLKYSYEATFYRGSFSILVSAVLQEEVASDPSVLSRGEEGESSQRNPFQIDYSTLIEILQSRGIIGNVVQELGEEYPYLTVDNILGPLDINRVQNDRADTRIIEASFVGEDPELVQEVIDVLSQVYLKFSLEERRKSLNEGIEFIDQQMPGINTRIGTLRDEIIGIQGQYLIADPNSELNNISSRIEQISNEIVTARRQLQENTSLIASLESQLGQTSDEALLASTLAESPGYQELLLQLRDIESRIELESVRFSSSSPVVRTLNQQRDAILLLLESNTREQLRTLQDNQDADLDPTVSTQFQGSVRRNLSQQLLNAQNEQNLLQTRIESLTETEAFIEARAQELPSVIRRYEEIQSDLRILEGRKSQLLSLRETLRIESTQTKEPWRIVSPPLIPRDLEGEPLPIPKSLPSNLLLGLGIGTVLGCFLSVVWEEYKDFYYTVKDIQSATSLPILGVVPFLRFQNSSRNFFGKRSSNSLFEEEIKSDVFDSIYTKLGLLSSSSGFQSILISSAAQGDGKSTLAHGLAKVASEKGKNVLLIEDKIDKGGESRKGNSNSSSDVDPSNECFTLALPDLSLPLTARYENSDGFWLSESSTSMISQLSYSSDRGEYIKSELGKEFDMVIFDSRNLTELPSGLLLASIADICVLTVGIQHTKRTVFQNMLSELFRFTNSRMGIVVNHLSTNR